MKPNYGIDALPVIRNLGLISVAGWLLFAASFAVNFFGGFRNMFLGFGVSFAITALLMLVYAKFGKFRHRDRMLKMIDWRGDENVLDVGTGRGLLMIGAAKRLTSGKAVGIDIFNKGDLSGNSPENGLKNAEIEGVSSKIEIRNEDAREMSFADGAFDVVLSNLCLHNIPDDDGRRKACTEIVRVLKPGGVAVISDFKNTKLYQEIFEKAGLSTTRSTPYFLDTFPPLRIVVTRK